VIEGAVTSRGFDASANGRRPKGIAGLRGKRKGRQENLPPFRCFHFAEAMRDQNE